MNTATRLLAGAASVAVCLGLAHGVAVADSPRLVGCVATYEEGERHLGDIDVDISGIQPAEMPSGRIDTVSSPQGSGVLMTYAFDSMQAGSGRIVVAIQPRGRETTFLSFYPARSVRAHWLNERLVYIEAWWGRIAASEMIFDGLEGRFVYRKLAHYAFTLDPECAEMENRSSSRRSNK